MPIGSRKPGSLIVILTFEMYAALGPCIILFCPQLNLNKHPSSFVGKDKI
jgi:hypothetical protein